MSHDHDHEHDDGQDVPSDMELRVKALESLLVEKGLVDPAALDAIIDASLAAPCEHVLRRQTVTASHRSPTRRPSRSCRRSTPFA